MVRLGTAQNLMYFVQKAVEKNDKVSLPVVLVPSGR